MSNKITDYHLFWQKYADGTLSPFSNFYKPSQKIKMRIGDHDYFFATTEHAFHAYKAILFDPSGAELQKIIVSDNPQHVKNLGRKVKNFDPKVWDKKKYDIMVSVNLAKFTQFAGLKKRLLETKEKHFAEASPYDKIWGIGLREEDVNRRNIKPKDWKGQNLLGKALDQVRDMIRQEEKKIEY